MAKKRTQQHQTNRKKEQGSLTLADALGENVLSKLKEAKSELSEEAAKAEEERKQQAIRERKEREANKSFAELLEEFDGPVNKY